MGFLSATKKIAKGTLKVALVCTTAYILYQGVKHVTKPVWDYDRMIFKAAGISDKHPAYGNRNGELDLMEKEKICTDIGEELPKNQHIPYSVLEQYVYLYTKK